MSSSSKCDSLAVASVIRQALREWDDGVFAHLCLLVLDHRSASSVVVSRRSAKPVGSTSRQKVMIWASLAKKKNRRCSSSANLAGSLPGAPLGCSRAEAKLGDK